MRGPWAPPWDACFTQTEGIYYALGIHSLREDVYNVLVFILKIRNFILEVCYSLEISSLENVILEMVNLVD